MILYPGHCSETRGVGVEGAQERQRTGGLKKRAEKGKMGRKRGRKREE